MVLHVGLVRFSLLCICLMVSGVVSASARTETIGSIERIESSGDIAASETTSLKEKIDQAIVKFEQTDRKHWGFTVNRFENEEGDITESVEQFTPNAEINKRWLLISANGVEATKNQQEKFLKKKQKQAKKNKQKAKAKANESSKKASDNNSYTIKLRELINQNTLAFHSETNRHIEMSFQVTLNQFGDETKGKLDGLLSYSKQNQFIETITITNNAEFSPMFSASINELLLTFNFVEIDNAILFREHALQMKGSFAYFVDIDEVSKDTYFDYQYHAAVE